MNHRLAVLVLRRPARGLMRRERVKSASKVAGDVIGLDFSRAGRSAGRRSEESRIGGRGSD